MQLSQPTDFIALYEQGVRAKTLNITIVRTEFNDNLVDGLEWGAKHAFCQLGGNLEENCKIVQVPGVVELPLVCQRVATNPNIDAIVALGTVIRGDTAHFDYVCQMGSQGIMQAMLNTNKSITFGILTTDNIQQAQVRCQQNDDNKGIEAMVAAIKVCCLKIETIA